MLYNCRQCGLTFSAMFEKGNKTNVSRRGLLAIIMLMILIASVAVAYWLSSFRQKYNDTGTKIVQEIQQATLSSLWKQRPVQRYYIISQDDKVVGWSAFFRVPTEKGDYQNLEIIMSIHENKWLGAWEYSLINETASEGQYLAGFAGIADGNIQLAPDTGILLKEGTVSVRQNRLLIPSQSVTPPNYLPEGTLPAAMQLVAKEKQRAYFKLIYNTEINRPVKGEMSTTRFGLANINFRGKEKIKVGDAEVDVSVVSLQRGVLGREEMQVQYLDDNGNALRIESGSQIFNIVNPEQVFEKFPQAEAVIEAIASNRLIGFPLAEFQKKAPTPVIPGNMD